MLDQRKEARLPAFLGAVISYKHKFWRADCIVKNTSDGGVKLLAPNLPTIPDKFDLTIPQRNLECSVRLKWRRDGELGVAIEHSQPLADTNDELRRDRRTARLKRENAMLRQRLSLADYCD
jgi:hypothetical protein